MDNILISEELSYDTRQLMDEHINLLNNLNVEQKQVYNAVVNSDAEKKRGALFRIWHWWHRENVFI